MVKKLTGWILMGRSSFFGKGWLTTLAILWKVHWCWDPAWENAGSKSIVCTRITPNTLLVSYIKWSLSCSGPPSERVCTCKNGEDKHSSSGWTLDFLEWIINAFCTFLHLHSYHCYTLFIWSTNDTSDNYLQDLSSQRTIKAHPLIILKSTDFMLSYRNRDK